MTTGTWWVGTVIDVTWSLVWQARFGEHIPAHLVAAFTAVLTDPRPVLRTGIPTT
ncbi:DUF317 domain-containing protein [Streptomyces sp. NPDC053750]|uniref:DUF317 domain-containing protein n=1 Tax=Streptomyces sp. NPDC053750 TaxID=3365714 RepID=UPI0037CD8F30